jgi:3-deoxy-D-manno-octulosonate 8-phosphate phosphatase (KDO 8-P phosphatase)
MSPSLYLPPTYPKAVYAAAFGIKLLLLDVDGVLSNGQIIWDEAAIESKAFSVKDGQGLRRLRQQKGIQTGIVTARKSQLVERRAKELDFDFVFQAVPNKLEAVQALAAQLALPASAIAFMGDDWPDLAVLQWVGLPACPKDAIAPVLQSSLFISHSTGGQGAVRELTDLLEQV